MHEGGRKDGESGNKNKKKKKKMGEKREKRLGRLGVKVGLLSPGSCYVSHYVSPGHRQHANRQNKRVSLAWHGSYFPILNTGSGRGQAAG